MSINKKAESKNAAGGSNPTNGNVAPVIMSEEEKSKWSSKRQELLKAYYAELLGASPETLQALARQRVARLLDERCNTAASKVALLTDSASLATLAQLLESKRMDAASKANTQEAFANLLMSGTLKGESKKSALEVFKGGKVADMAAFLLTQSQASTSK